MASQTMSRSIDLSNNPYAKTLQQLRKKPKMNLDQVQRTIQQQIQQKTPNDADLFRHVFKMFGRPKDGITPGLFRKQLHTQFGIRLSDAEARELFGRYDLEGTGSVSLQAFVRRAMPPDYTRKLWNVQRDEAIDLETTSKLQNTGSVYVQRMPASLEKVRWSIEKIEDHIQRKIIERTKRASDQYREAYALFGSPAHGISKSAFKGHMQKLGIILNNAELTALFNRYDSDGSGSITFAELVDHVMPKDYTRPTWNHKRDLENESQEHDRTHKFEPVVRQWPKSLQRNRMTLEEVEFHIQRKITERTKRASDQYREAYQLFGSPAHGITPAHFHKQLSKLGLVLSDGEVRTLFKKYDSDGSGNISFSELVSHIMPADFTRKPWNIQRDEEIDRQSVKKHSRSIPVLHEWPKPLAKNRMSVMQMEKLIQEKIIQRTKRANDQYREAYALFGSPSSGISPTSFKYHLQKLGLVVSDEDVSALFHRYDSDGSGRISFQELVNWVMPKDYTRPSWNVRRDEENDMIEEAKRELILEESRPLARSARQSMSHRSTARSSKSRQSRAPRHSGRSSRSRRSGRSYAGGAGAGAGAGAGIMLTGRSMSATNLRQSRGPMSPIALSGQHSLRHGSATMSF